MFLAGCGLPETWRGRRHFTVAELGFGTGLNIVALLDLWRRARPANGRLNVLSVEAHLLDRGEAARALSAWPEVAETAALLLERWPRPVSGFHRMALDDIGATVDIAIMEVEEALHAWSGSADAWFLDGFSPALNPDMWRREVIELVTARSAPGARLATYTVAGAVRRDLAAAGFQVERKPGFGRKRERLEARLDDGVAGDEPTKSVAIIGGGIAAASLRRAFKALGVQARVFAGSPDKPSASAAPAALVAPRLDAGLGAHAALFAQAFHRAVDLYEALPDAVIARGALQRAADVEDSRRFAKIAGGALFDPAKTLLIGPADLSAREPADGLLFDDALVVEPSRILDRWLGDDTAAETVTSIRRGALGWCLALEGGGGEVAADIVVIAAGFASAALVPELRLGAVRGQASLTGGETIERAVLSSGYAMPTRDGVMFGATHDRGDDGLDERERDHARNLATLRGLLPELAARVSGGTLVAHVGTRATTKDFMPLAGMVDPERPELFVLTGLGSRGYCLAPLLAEHVAALAVCAPSPLPLHLAALTDPQRLARREQRARSRRD